MAKATNARTNRAASDKGNNAAIYIPDHFEVRHGKVDEPVTIRTDAWANETVVGLLEFAIREKLNNAAAGRNGDEAAQAIAGMVDALNNGVVARGGGGGPRITPLERAMRAVVEAALRKDGVKSPAKAARDWMAKATPEQLADVRKAAEAQLAAASQLTL